MATDDSAPEASPTECPACGANVSATAEFCSSCGASTKKKKAGSESAPSQEGHVADTPDLASQIAAGMGAAFEKYGFTAKGEEKPDESGATESAPTNDKATEGAEDKGAVKATETAPAASVTEQIEGALTAEREASAKALQETLAENNKQLVAGIGEAMAKGFTQMRDELRTELVEANGPQRSGQVGATREARAKALAESNGTTPLHQLPAHERDKAHQDYMALQMESVYSPGFVEAVATQNRYAG